MHVDLEPDQFGCDFGETLSAALRPAILNCDGAPVDPAEFVQPLHESRSPWRPRGCGRRPQIADGRELPHLLRPRRERPRGRSAAEERDEVAPPEHSITSSARASNDGGTSMPSALAVLRLITNSNLVGAWTGSSAGFAPLRMRSTYWAARRNWSTRSGP